MPEYDLNVCAWQIVKITASNEEDAIEQAFYEAFGNSRDHFATTKYEICGIEPPHGEREGGD